MIIYKELLPFVVVPSCTLKAALQKIENNKHKIVYVVDERNYLKGCLADGDYRRWSISRSVIDLNTPVLEVANSACFSMNHECHSNEIEKMLEQTNRSIPLVDDEGHVVAIVEKGTRFISIDDRRISDEDPAYLIAEIGNNHQGDLDLAKKMIALAAEKRVDCIKFQMRNMASLYSGSGGASDPSADLGVQYVLGLLEKYQLTDDDLFEAFDYCYSLGITPICTPWDIDSLAALEKYGMCAYKVASADFTNYPLLEAIAATGKPMICSTGMSTEDEIRGTSSFLERKKALYILLHCNSTYPTPFKDINLSYIKTLQRISNGIVGYSGHERGWSVCVAAVTLGAKVIEKHFTLDKSYEGNDHKVSLLPEELGAMVDNIRNVELSLGDSAPRALTQGELMNREILAKSLVANTDISMGDIISADVIDVKGPGKGLQPSRLSELIGKKISRNLVKGELFFETDLTEGVIKKEMYSFDRPYGIPVRYHDFKSLSSDVLLDFVEFHLSYNDLDIDISKFICEQDKMGLAVHAPELFANDHLLDLASFDVGYRQKSISELQRVIYHLHDLTTFFPATNKPVLVVNVGGWSETGFLDEKSVLKKYELVRDALIQLDSEGLEIAIQTMPPFPWHFGGQRYHNLFVEGDQIKKFCEETGVGLCLDVSHTMMACNYYDMDLYRVIADLSPYIVHMHIVDAKGVDGEGVQIGRGDVDFERLGHVLSECLPNIQFIPEVWQGHNNKGEGFWKALDYLERKWSNFREIS